MTFENNTSLAIALIVLCTLTGLAILASVYFYCCHVPKRIPTLRRQSYSLSMKAKNDPDSISNIKFLDPADTMNRNTSFEVRSTQPISSSPALDELIVHSSMRGFSVAEPRSASDVTRFLPNWRRLLQTDTARRPLTASVDRDVSTGLEDPSLDSMLRKFDSLVLSFRWTESASTQQPQRSPRDESLEVFSCKSSISLSNSSFLSLHWGRHSMTMSETDIFKSISSESLDDDDDDDDDEEVSHINI